MSVSCFNGKHYYDNTAKQALDNIEVRERNRTPKPSEQKAPINKESSPPLLKIVLQDIDSVPDVYYQGKRVSEFLVDMDYQYHTTGDCTVNNGMGLNDIRIEHYN